MTKQNWEILTKLSSGSAQQSSIGKIEAYRLQRKVLTWQCSGMRGDWLTKQQKIRC